MADLGTISELGTAAGTLALAVATFVSIRAGQRAARVAERTLLAGLRPVLFPTRIGDRDEKVTYSDQHLVVVAAGHGVAEVTPRVIYLALTVRNAGAGIAVLDRWCLRSDDDAPSPEHAPLDRFRRLTRDLYVPAGDSSFWQGALRDPSEEEFARTRRAIEARERIIVELLYGDVEGGQHTISRFTLLPLGEDAWLNVLSRHWHLDAGAPR